MANDPRLTPELREKVNAASSPDELLEIATEHDIPLTPEYAVLLYAELHPEIMGDSEEE